MSELDEDNDEPATPASTSHTLTEASIQSSDDKQPAAHLSPVKQKRKKDTVYTRSNDKVWDLLDHIIIGMCAILCYLLTQKLCTDRSQLDIDASHEK